jgi:hypothetical protein
MGVASDAVTWDQKVDAAHRGLRSRRDIQFDFQPVQPIKPPPWAEWLREALESIGPALPYVFWGGLAVGVLLVAWFVTLELLPDRRRSAALIAPVDWRPDPSQARALLADADTVAAQGRYAEAIRLLLIRSVEHLSGRRPGLVKPALTSRDIAALDTLPDAPRGAFARLAQAVERTLFAGRPASEADFRQARGDYEAFAFPDAWR